MSRRRTSSCGRPSSLKGAKGMVIDTCCATPSDRPEYYKYDLCAVLRQMDNNSLVRLYNVTSEDSIAIRNVKDVNGLMKKLLKLGDGLAVKYYFSDNEADSYKEMKNDMIGDKRLRQIYRTKGLQYLTTSLRLKYELFEFCGMSVVVGGKMHYYYISGRCTMTLDQLDSLTDKSFRLLVIQLLESFAILHSKEYYHGDVKLQNMMKCPTKDITYKLIDWGRLYPVHRFDEGYMYGGSKQFGSPLGFYLMFRNKTKHLLPYSNAADLSFRLFEGRLPSQPLKCPLIIEYEEAFRPWWKEIQIKFRRELDRIKSKDGVFSTGINSDKQLFMTYRYTMDLYNLGLCFLYLIFKHHLKLEKYKTFIERLVYYGDNMILSATEALRVFKRKQL